MRRFRLPLTLCLVILAAWGTARLTQRSRAVVEPTLQVDPLTQSVLAGADRVETFRLADFHEHPQTKAEFALLDKGGLGSLDDHTIIRIGKTQDAAFARRLLHALSIANDPAHSFMPSCFDPGVGFRAWTGKAHTDIVICFYCSGVEIQSKDASGKPGAKTHVDLGAARPALLALSREAFPDDTRLRDLPTEGGRS